MPALMASLTLGSLSGARVTFSQSVTTLLSENHGLSEPQWWESGLLSRKFCWTLLTLVPACFLFAFSYGLLNRSIDKWFGIPFDVVHTDATEVVRQLAIQAENRARHLAVHLTTSSPLAEAA